MSLAAFPSTDGEGCKSTLLALQTLKNVILHSPDALQMIILYLESHSTLIENTFEATHSFYPENEGLS
jgi:hypothetical protein